MTVGTEIDALVEAIKPILAGQEAGIQGAVLSDLVATHLAGHFAHGKKQTAKLRSTLLSLHISTVRRLIPVCEAEILAHLRKSAS